MDIAYLIGKSNLVNWLILIAFFIYLWNKNMPAIFGERRRKIQETLDEATRAREEGQKFLADQKQRIANAEVEAERILADAKKVAEQMKVQIAEQTKKDAEELKHKITQQIDTQKQMAITELRSQAATVAVRLAEASLPGAITDGVKKGLQDQFVKQMELIGEKK
jgi:F-type H+-transporting ATPase subunit b